MQYASFTVVRRVTPFSFVVVTLYIIATLFLYAMNYADLPGNPTQLLRFGLIAIAWRKYVFFASIQKMYS
jgi:hypothetical protein